MKRQTKKQKAVWADYERIMLAARDAARSLADAFEDYARRVNRDYVGSWLETVRLAEHRYADAMRAADGYHFASMPRFGGYGINASAEELLAAARELRGTAIPVTIEGPEGRRCATFRYGDDGIAGFFHMELRSMRKFGSPRRMPSKGERAAA